MVYRLPPISLGVVTAREGVNCRVRIGSAEAILELDPSVDPVLIDEAIADERRVVVDPSSNTVCGLLQTTRAVTIDRSGVVSSTVRRFEITAEESALLRTATSFLKLDDERAEIYAREAVVRARGAVRALARLIKLN
ncbi:MAG: hypothetical protein EVA89_00525 [Sandaracinaceae bacterium]|nr:MAG: hypothetical protein EVA89_00525 [Sandaracinaceae bacterium]